MASTASNAYSGGQMFGPASLDADVPGRSCLADSFQLPVLVERGVPPTASVIRGADDDAVLDVNVYTVLIARVVRRENESLAITHDHAYANTS